MRLFALLFAWPIALIVYFWVVLFAPALALFVVFFFFGTASVVFTWAAVICLAWVFIEHRQLRKGARRLARIPGRH